MLARLRHDALVGGDHEQHQVHAAHAGQHVLHESFMTRHIDQAHAHSGRRDQRREAQVNRDPALLLLGQPVGVHAGQPADERGLAMINVAGGADHGQAARDG